MKLKTLQRNKPSFSQIEGISVVEQSLSQIHYSLNPMFFLGIEYIIENKCVSHQFLGIMLFIESKMCRI